MRAGRRCPAAAPTKTDTRRSEEHSISPAAYRSNATEALTGTIGEPARAVPRSMSTASTSPAARGRILSEIGHESAARSDAAKAQSTSQFLMNGQTASRALPLGRPRERQHADCRRVSTDRVPKPEPGGGRPFDFAKPRSPGALIVSWPVSSRGRNLIQIKKMSSPGI